MTELLVVAGEASGDLHGARLITELRRHVPDLAPFGLGGDEMRAAGLEAVAHSSEISVVGITEVLKILPRAREVFADLLREVDRRRPALAVLVDFPDFNLRLAKELKARGLEVLYYISPQVWAWRRGRVKTIARLVDRMLVLFPFEVDFYRDHDVDVVHVGHPLVDEVPVLPQAWDRDEASFGGPYQIALLPGSRKSEVESLLPTLLEAVRRLAGELPIEVRIIRAPTIPPELVDEAVELAGLPVEIVGEDRFAAIADSHLALCASGTATLEVGLLGTPMIMVYRLASWTYVLAKLLVHLPNVSLVNLVLGRRVVPELIQGDANPRRIAAEAARLLTDAGERGRMREALAEVRGRLGEGGASRRAAAEVAAMMTGRPAGSTAELTAETVAEVARH
ncbi:MAG TPA: lipid-A-disaccharide synthase [Thermoanaerobaculia bacterium]|jgi:lipid-A-disaccharide synthase|nr:lipid-A-disaccharide synthase [Thermoanaerobaculia bacterium]